MQDYEFTQYMYTGLNSELIGRTWHFI